MKDQVLGPGKVLIDRKNRDQAHTQEKRTIRMSIKIGKWGRDINLKHILQLKRSSMASLYHFFLNRFYSL